MNMAHNVTLIQSVLIIISDQISNLLVNMSNDHHQKLIYFNG